MTIGEYVVPHSITIDVSAHLGEHLIADVGNVDFLLDGLGWDVDGELWARYRRVTRAVNVPRYYYVSQGGLTSVIAPCRFTARPGVDAVVQDGGE